MGCQVALLMIVMSDALFTWKLIAWSSTVKIVKCPYTLQLILEMVKTASDRARLLCSGDEARRLERRLFLQWSLVALQNCSLCPIF